MDGFMDKIAQKLSAQEAIRANAAADAAQIERLEAQVAEYDACIKEMRKLNLRSAENDQKLKEMLETVHRQMKVALGKNSEQMDQLMKRSNEQIEKLVEKSNEQINQLSGKSNEQIDRLMKNVNEQISQLAEGGNGQIAQLVESGSEQMRRTAEECMNKLQGAEESIAETEKRGEEMQELLESMQTLVLDKAAKMEEMFRQTEDFVHRENVKVYRNVQAATAEEIEKQTQAIISSQQELAGKNKRMYVVSVLALITSIVNLGLLIAYFTMLY